VPLHEAVNLATLNPAKAARISNHTGSIEAGKDADLLLVKLVNNIPMVTHTIVQGYVVAQAGHKKNRHTEDAMNDNVQVINEI
jgi:alpha-D-ribose 1-methylphosphonate 5-triphosphate diphosphatase